MTQGATPSDDRPVQPSEGQDPAPLTQFTFTDPEQQDRLRQAGQFLLEDPTTVSPEQLLEAKGLLEKAGFDLTLLACALQIPVERTPELIVKNPLTEVDGMVASVEETIRNFTAEGVLVFRPELNAIFDEILPENTTFLTMATLGVMSDPMIEVTEEEVAHARAVLEAANVDTAKAGILYGLMPERVAEFFARDQKGVACFSDSIEEELAQRRELDHPIFKS